MAFNFGEKPFKHSLPDGYNAVSTAPADRIVVNTNGEASTASITKPVNNSPQAVVIEVV